MTLLEFVLVCMLIAMPARFHAPLAIAITHAVEAAPPLLANDEKKRRTAALLVAVTFRESGGRPTATGDCPHLPAGSPLCTADKATAWGAFQVALPRGAKTSEGVTGRELLADPDMQATVALRMLRESLQAARTCGSELGLYAAGPQCSSERAKRISADRMAIAKSLYRRASALEAAQ